MVRDEVYCGAWNTRYVRNAERPSSPRIALNRNIGLRDGFVPRSARAGGCGENPDRPKARNESHSQNDSGPRSISAVSMSAGSGLVVENDTVMEFFSRRGLARHGSNPTALHGSLPMDQSQEACASATAAIIPPASIRSIFSSEPAPTTIETETTRGEDDSIKAGAKKTLTPRFQMLMFVRSAPQLRLVQPSKPWQIGSESNNLRSVGSSEGLLGLTPSLLCDER